MKNILQSALDTALRPNVSTYDQRKLEGTEADEYIVYSQNRDGREFHADNAPLVKAASFTVRYYYRIDKISTYAGRQAVKAREDLIESALINAGFVIPDGRFDAGDVDDIGYMVTVFECEYWRVV